MLVTVIVDASFYDKPRVAAWAFWIISSRGKFQYSGLFAKPMESSGHAELCAVGNALYLGLKHPVCSGATKMLVQTDCQEAIRAIAGEHNGRHEEAVNLIDKLKATYGVEIETRHVKGHAGRGTPRNYCQDWCDAEARRLAKRVWNKLCGQNEERAARPKSKKGKPVAYKPYK